MSGESKEVEIKLSHIPSYNELPELVGTGERHSWRVFGDGDELGTLNNIDRDAIVSAAGLVKTGEVVSLNLPIAEAIPGFWSKRIPAEHHQIVTRSGRDDYLEQFYPQYASHWDSLRHVRYREFGYYGGVDEEDLNDTNLLGIGKFADRGIIGRGVLVDAERYCRLSGIEYSPNRRFGITGDLIARVLHFEGVSISRGDILLLRTGWLGWYRSLAATEREKMRFDFEDDPKSLEYPGVDPGRDTAAWLWNSEIAAIADDNPTLETLQYIPSEGWAHHRLLPLLGMVLGELWVLDGLAETCAREERYAFFLASAPLSVPAGVGSPANAYAIF